MRFKNQSHRRRPFKRSGRRKKRLPNIQQVQKYFPSNMGSAVRYAVKGVNLMKSLINSEKKRFDHEVNATPSTTQSFVNVNDIAAGDDYNQRNGNSILCNYIYMKLMCAINSAVTTQTFVRITLFIDMDNDGQTPTSAELLTQANDMLAPINPDYSARFTILYDKTIALEIGAGPRTFLDDFYKLIEYHQKYTTTASTGFGKGSVWLALLSSELTNTPNVDVWYRQAFYDN